jgi:hypothetical protein
MFCFPGNTEAGCGSGGAVCAQCPSNQLCTNQKCTPCTSANCNGCCDSFGACQTGDTDLQCGRGGISCILCSGFTSCLGGSCQ